MYTVSESPDITNQYVSALRQFSHQDLDLAGGKAANLGELIRAGFSVPEGFVVNTESYTHFVESNHLDEILSQSFQQEREPGLRIRAAFENAPTPQEIEESITSAYRQLGGGPVAVRSSATAEDLPQAAFAGQQDTYLNVIGEQALLDSVRRCWASLWSDRAISYRSRQEQFPQAVRLAVVVQKMVPADIAGVMFTANPITGDRDETVMDASPGLGEAVVSGLVTPDHFVLKKTGRGWKILERRAGRREVIIRPLAEGGTERVEGPASSGTLTLDDQALFQLASTGASIQSHFGSPQDIEWAFSAGKLYLLQARPMTALPEPMPHPSRPIKLLASMFAEMFPIRPYPLDQATWVHAISSAAVEPIFKLVGIQVPQMEQLFSQEDGVIVRFLGKVEVHPTPAILLAPAQLVWLSLKYDPLHYRADPLLVSAISRAKELEAQNLQDLSWNELLNVVRQALSLAMPLAGEIRRRYYPRSLLANGMLWVILKLMGLGDCFGPLISATDSLTIQANRILEELAGQIRSDPVLAAAFDQQTAEQLDEALSKEPAGRAFLVRLNDFLERFGHREVVLSTVLQPTWKDDPKQVLGMLKGMARTVPERAGAQQAVHAALQKVQSHPWMHISFVRSSVLSLIAEARCFWQIRENTHYEATRILPILRRTLLELGQRLVETGMLASPEEIFHLEFSQLERLGEAWPPSEQRTAEIRAIVQRRKEKRQSLESVPVVDPRLYQPAEQAAGALLTGTPGSPGEAEGQVRVIHDSSEFGALQPGEVLVAPYTNPAWTLLFQRAAAVVVDGGSAGSHAAIVAREYGIPAVMGTIDGTRRLSDGQRVRVNGTQGQVFKA